MFQPDLILRIAEKVGGVGAARLACVSRECRESICEGIAAEHLWKSLLVRDYNVEERFVVL